MHRQHSKEPLTAIHSSLTAPECDLHIGLQWCTHIALHLALTIFLSLQAVDSKFEPISSRRDMC